METDTHGFFVNKTIKDLIPVIQKISIGGVLLSDSHHESFKTLSFDYSLNSEQRRMSCYEVIIDKKKSKEITDYLTTHPKAKYEDEWFRYADTNNFISEGIPNKTKGVQTSLGMNDEAIEIMSILCGLLDGYLDFNDCDTEGYKKLNQERKRNVVKSLFQ
jgi:hypothetical protein